MKSEILKPWLVLVSMAFVAVVNVPAVQAENKTVVVFGATGKIGGLIVDEALRHGHKVFGKEVGRERNVAAQIEAGQVHVNGPTIRDQPQVAFGGIKASGYGRFNVVEAIDEFTDTRVMTTRSQSAHYPI